MLNLQSALTNGVCKTYVSNPVFRPLLTQNPRKKVFFFYKPTKPKKKTYDIFSKITQQHRSRGSRSPTIDVGYVVIHWFFSYSFNIFLFLLLSTGPDQWTKCLSLGSVTFASRQPLDNELNWILSLWRAICACLNTQLHDTHENKNKKKHTINELKLKTRDWFCLFMGRHLRFDVFRLWQPY